MEAKKIRKKFIQFFKERGHAVVPSSSLIPDDPSVLLTTAGMQQFKPYYTGEADAVRDFGSKNTASVQKSFRTSDIDEVGDESHLTFFEMLGNFSFGGPDASSKVGTSYWKKEAIAYAHDFITKELGLPISCVTIFRGEQGVPKDDESKEIWKSLGIPEKNIREEGMGDVFWGPTGTSGPCGPTTEIYCKNADGKDIEVWNIVFNEFFCSGSREQLLAGNATLKPLPIKGVDTGMGLERLAMIAQKTRTIFDTDLLASLVSLLPPELEERKRRVIADHARGVAFLLADGVRPSNKGAGYVLRRLMRRVMAYEKIDNVPSHVIDAMIHEVIHEYGEFYPELSKHAEAIRKEFLDERERFGKTLQDGSRALDHIIEQKTPAALTPSDRHSASEKEAAYKMLATIAFDIYQNNGFPIDVTMEYLKRRGVLFNTSKLREHFNMIFLQHQEISRAGVEKKFGGHGLLLDTGELKAGSEEELKIVTRLHTATHLLNAALRKVLGDTVEQRGSDITPERTRFDFLFPRKVTPEELTKVQELVNYAIQKDFPMTIQEMNLDDAKNSGALFFYKGKYPERVKVYTAGNDTETFSKELCGGPHVTHTGEIGAFKIIKEEASSAGVRRIRAVIG